MLRCGFYEMDITPFIGSHIPGNFEKRKMTGILDIPHAKAIVVEKDGEKVAIVCSDILYIYGESYKKILDRVCEYTDLKRENIMVAATHSHSGGSTDYDLFNEDSKLYVEMAWRKAADAIILANQRLQEATAGFGSVEMEDSNFVRDFYMKDGSLVTQPKYNDPVDRPESEPDRLEAEKLDFHYRVYDGYKRICENDPDRVKRIDASMSVDEIKDRIYAYLEELCEKKSI